MVASLLKNADTQPGSAREIATSQPLTSGLPGDNRRETFLREVTLGTNLTSLEKSVNVVKGFAEGRADQFGVKLSGPNPNRFVPFQGDLSKHLGFN